uniref:Uncharacterized protein n=1 Tax=Arundo donax TaxID=35708 RepID=A0A0A9CXT5_ARUDO
MPFFKVSDNFSHQQNLLVNGVVIYKRITFTNNDCQTFARRKMMPMYDKRTRDLLFLINISWISSPLSQWCLYVYLPLDASFSGSSAMFSLVSKTISGGFHLP